MLRRLQVSSFAIISNCDIAFEKGFTVLTGPTGAGKSLIIDSLSLLLGGRASTEMIRQGEEKAYIKGTFEIEDPSFWTSLVPLGIRQGQEIVIERIISKKGSQVKLNGVNITLSDLTYLAPRLADIHSQFDFAKILNQENYLSILDQYGESLLSPYKDSYSSLYADYLRQQDHLATLKKQQEDFKAHKDFNLYQYNELKALNFYPGEKEEIEKEIAILSNFDKVYATSSSLKESISSNCLDPLYEIEEKLSALVAYQPELEPYLSSIKDANITLADSFSSLSRHIRDLDYDPNRLEELLQRQFDLKAIERKYGKDVDQLIALRDSLSSLIDNEDGFLAQIEEAEKALRQAYEAALTKAKEISKLRHQIAKRIEKDIKKDLADLLLQAEFEVSFQEIPLSTNGIDAIDFLIQTNVGEGLKSLEKTVSGGEASRLMLAFKSLLLKAKSIPTAIFDEIDTGISGEVAMAVAHKIAEISRFTQVIAITHMPQVASLSDHHILISKSVKEGRTYTFVKKLGLEEKIEEIAHLISGGKVSPTQREYAKEMVYSKK